MPTRSWRPRGPSSAREAGRQPSGLHGRRGARGRRGAEEAGLLEPGLGLCTLSWARGAGTHRCAPCCGAFRAMIGRHAWRPWAFPPAGRMGHGARDGPRETRAMGPGMGHARRAPWARDGSRETRAMGQGWVTRDARHGPGMGHARRGRGPGTGHARRGRGPGTGHARRGRGPGTGHARRGRGLARVTRDAGRGAGTGHARRGARAWARVTRDAGAGLARVTRDAAAGGQIGAGECAAGPSPAYYARTARFAAMIWREYRAAEVGRVLTQLDWTWRLQGPWPRADLASPPIGSRHIWLELLHSRHIGRECRATEARPGS
jgi:hypothetical protein